MVIERGLVQVNGRDLDWLACGSGPVTVVLEAGLTASANAWLGLLPRLAPHCRAVAVSRAGYGRSTPAKRPAAQDSVNDLLAALDALHVRGPIVLVGHSWGGLLCRLLAAQQPERLAGLILVDATHEALDLMRRRSATALGLVAMSLGELRARLGATRRQLSNERNPLGQLLRRQPAALREALLEDMTNPATWQQARRDFPAVKRLLDGLHTRPVPVPTVPVVAVVGGKSDGRDAKLRTLMHDTYQRWLSQLPHGRLVTAPHSGHLVPFEDDDLLLHVIVELVTQVAPSER